MKIILFLLVGFTSVNSFAQKSFLLKQNYPVGKKYDYSLISSQIISQKFGATTVNITQDIGTDYFFVVAGEINGDKNINVIYNRIYMKSVTGGNTMILDSNVPDSTKKNPFSGLKGARFSMVFAPNGEIKAVTGIDKMVAKMATEMTNDTSEVKQIQNSLTQQFNAEMVKQTMESSFKIYPEKPVKIGDSWTVDTKIKMSMPIETITKYTLKDVKNGIATLNVNGTLLSKGNFETMGNKLETDLKGTNSGDVEMDIKSGMVINSHLRIDLFGTMKSMGKNIDFDMQGINKITGKEVN
ncbi:DUF6263 family protein [Pedobacter mucosus]|uniref:DUF6263 family protein n=1 Tax=Pedobacter mucosus TaxID=2895286 RepID=UPI001EE4A409|nr:DUF6263 family protein [Pedobacter mucosus]UKT63753.1 DUF6263 family protein [Pedobacter mucosus]